MPLPTLNPEEPGLADPRIVQPSSSWTEQATSPGCRTTCTFSTSCRVVEYPALGA